MALSLCFYFIYHTFHGERSILNLAALNQKIATLSLMHDTKKAERIALEKKVIMMRPGTLDKDLLEEQARAVLGYKSENELVILPQ